MDSQGRVLDYDKPRRLAVTWRVEWLPDYRDLPQGIVIFDLASSGETVRLTVSEIHDPALPEKFKEGGRTGWPIILSGLEEPAGDGTRAEDRNAEAGGVIFKSAQPKVPLRPLGRRGI